MVQKTRAKKQIQVVPSFFVQNLCPQSGKKTWLFAENSESKMTHLYKDYIINHCQAYIMSQSGFHVSCPGFSTLPPLSTAKESPYGLTGLGVRSFSADVVGRNSGTFRETGIGMLPYPMTDPWDEAVFFYPHENA